MSAFCKLPPQRIFKLSDASITLHCRVPSHLCDKHNALSCRQLWADRVQRCYWINRAHGLQRPHWRYRTVRCAEMSIAHALSKLYQLKGESSLEGCLT